MPLPAPAEAATCEAAFRDIITDCALAADAALAVFLETDDIAGPHKARVALRRITTAIDAFQPILRRRVSARLRARAKRIFRSLGTVRDSDVHLRGPDTGREAQARLAQNRAIRDKARALLRKRGDVGFTQVLRSAAAEGGGLYRRSERARALRQSPVAGLCLSALDAAWTACRAHGDDLAALSETHRHEFRKDMKSLRYLVEFFQPQVAGLDDPAFQADLRLLQDDLGTLNDAHVGAALAGRKLPARLPDPVARALSRAGALWRRMAATTPPWDRAGADQATRRP